MASTLSILAMATLLWVALFLAALRLTLAAAARMERVAAPVRVFPIRSRARFR